MFNVTYDKSSFWRWTLQLRRALCKVTLFAGVEYTSIEIHVPDDYGFVTAGTVAGVPSRHLSNICRLCS